VVADVLEIDGRRPRQRDLHAAVPLDVLRQLRVVLERVDIGTGPNEYCAFCSVCRKPHCACVLVATGGLPTVLNTELPSGRSKNTPIDPRNTTFCWPLRSYATPSAAPREPRPDVARVGDAVAGLRQAVRAVA
jgi:hypothetical protein